MPASWPKRRSVTSLQLLIQLGLDLGLDLPTCLAGTGITPARLPTLQGEIDADCELRLIANLVQGLPDIEHLGLLAGERYRLISYGAWGYALLSSATVREAAALGLRYLGLTFAFTHISLAEQGQDACLLFDDSQTPTALLPFIVQRDMLGALVVIRELLGDKLPLLQVRMRQPAARMPQTFAKAFGHAVQFAADDNSLMFPATLLDKPLPFANPALVQACEQQCQAILARHKWDEGLTGQVRQLLLRTPGQLDDMERVAANLHMSSRTLRRRLNEEGIGFRALQDQVRQALAEDMLEAGGLSLEEIAERLGYGELSNFIHAFKRWKGTTPGRYQRGDG
ncbi:AraC family transcriptional regulator [Pseudomonas sp. GOM7]|uniref:AraC family transcriptional regulator n=1 Tax=Pseudomonas sp. GOM7 TaxID=2998079 RepID=UPI00227CF33A|nr:AraC family transcriptional regulator [Pseudomonas sp. GOM7]WAJ35989.1 AraC family transcriptional regulator [Pseudomonas sp. GOM7]